VDLGELSASVVPYVSAAVGAYGGAVIQKATEVAVEGGADATVGCGRRLLGRLLASERGPQLQDAVLELAAEQDDEASLGLLRAQVLKAVTADPQLAAELLRMVTQAGGGHRYQLTITKSSGFQVGSHNTQTNFLPPVK
jgi:hypothetical protein